ncbi:hypothetical protein [Flexivirga alba]|uniref:Lytic transglycosylase domain-containing protein n=1 Tax=Flexivirga alba TaxID=702742 RepID=A0ABW2ANL1_9MICO
MSRPVGRHRARRDTGIGALRRPAVAATAAISTVSVAAAAYSTAASANAAVVGTAQAKLLLTASTSTALRAANSGVAADGQAQLVAAQQAVSARKSADAKSRSAAAARTAAAAKLQSVAKSSVAAARKAADEKAAAKAAAAKKAAEAKRAAAAGTSRDSTRPPAASFSGSPQAYASSMLASYGWDQGQMGCLVSLWNRESGWNASAMNASSGAYGIPQSLPGSKMASAGADWRTNPATQIRWGLGYIKSTYGSPCGAWGHSQATGWY